MERSIQAWNTMVVATSATSRVVARAEQSGDLVRVFRNVLVRVDFLKGISRWELIGRINVVRALAAVAALGDQWILSHHSAAWILGIEQASEFQPVHVSRLRKWGGSQTTMPAMSIPGVPTIPAVALHRHHLPIPVEETIGVGPGRMTGSMLTAALCAATSPPLEGTVIVSGILRDMTGFSTHNQEVGRYREDAIRAHIAALVESLPRCSGKARARQVVGIADAGCGSVPKRMLLSILHSLGLTNVVTQAEFVVQGRRYFADFYLPDLGIIIEFDGKGKYGRERTEILASLTMRDQRQKDLESQGLIVIRFEYFELAHPERIRDEIEGRAGLERMSRPLSTFA